jgi:hypothetical protein
MNDPEEELLQQRWILAQQAQDAYRPTGSQGTDEYLELGRRVEAAPTTCATTRRPGPKGREKLSLSLHGARTYSVPASGVGDMLNDVMRCPPTGS